MIKNCQRVSRLCCDLLEVSPCTACGAGDLTHAHPSTFANELYRFGSLLLHWAARARLSPEIPAGTEIPGGGGGAALYRTLHVTTQLTVVRQVVMVCFGGGSALSLAEWESEEAVCKLQEVGNFVRERTRADRTEY